MRHRPTHRATETGTLLATLFLLTAGMATAQMGQGLPPMQQQQDPQARLQEIQQQLATAQEAAFAAHPELATQRDQLEDLVVETMEAHGYDPEARMATLDSLRGKAQDPSVSQLDRQQMMQSAQAAQQALQEGQQVALQDSSVVAAQEAFREDLMVAMRAENPATDDLLAEFEQLQQQVQMQRMRQMQQQQQRQPAPGPQGPTLPPDGGK
jgi:hypothetical protein